MTTEDDKIYKLLKHNYETAEDETQKFLWGQMLAMNIYEATTGESAEDYMINQMNLEAHKALRKAVQKLDLSGGSK